MRTFRFFRRTLLCLVVGVTAFGVAGWGFRLKPTWTAEIAGKRCEFIEHVEAPDDDEPIWVIVPDEQVLAFRSRDGAVLQSIPWPRSGNYLPKFAALAGARLAIEYHVDADSSKRRLEYFEIGRREPVNSTPLGDDWWIADDWLHAWRLKWHDDWDPNGGDRQSSYVFELQDLQSGKPTGRLDLSDDLSKSGQGYIAYSANADLLAISTELRKGGRPPYGIELRRASTGAVIKSLPVDLPANRLDHGPYEMEFQSGGRWLVFALLAEGSERSESYSLDVATGAIRPINPPDAPPNGELRGGVETRFASDGRRVAALYLGNPYVEDFTVWTALARPDEATTWHRVPAIPAVMDIGRLKPRATPGRNELVVRMTTRPFLADLPDLLKDLLPALEEQREDDSYFWHDWNSSEWRRAAHIMRPTEGQVRRAALVTLAIDADTPSILQSWPLPPRDPKWPAMGIAAACMTATWWLCARRHARKLRRAP